MVDEIVLRGGEKISWNIELSGQSHLTGKHLIFISCVLVFTCCLIGQNPHLIQAVALKLVYRRTQEASSERRYIIIAGSHSITTLLGATRPIKIQTSTKMIEHSRNIELFNPITWEINYRWKYIAPAEFAWLRLVGNNTPAMKENTN